MTTTDAIASLCRAIDAGDDAALLPLADALEDAGDGRAAGIRSAGRVCLTPVRLSVAESGDFFGLRRGPLTAWRWARLSGLAAGRLDDWLIWRSRSAAYLAWAEAQAETVAVIECDDCQAAVAPLADGSLPRGWAVWDRSGVTNRCCPWCAERRAVRASLEF